MESTNLYLAHHGIKGQKWGIRRFQNEDGSLTPEGMRRYGVDSSGRMSETGYKRYLKDQRKDTVETYHANKKDIRKNYKNLSKEERQEELKSRYGSEEEYENAKAEYRKHQGKKAVAISLGTVGAIVVHGAVAGAIIKGVSDKGREEVHDKQVTAIVNEGQQITDRLLQMQEEEKQLRLAKHRLKEGTIENTTESVYSHIKDAGGIYEDTPGVINNKGALYSFNYSSMNPKKAGKQVDKKEAVSQALGLNKKEQVKLQEKLDYLGEVLDDMNQKKNKRKVIVGGLYKGMQHSGWIIADENYLCHHGIKGQKWGIRRFQNEDGSLTPEGMKRYGVDSSGNMSKSGAYRYYKDVYGNAKSSGLRGNDLHNSVRSHFDSEEEYQQFLRNYKNQKAKRIATGIGIGAASAAAAGLTAYGISKGVSAAKERKLVAANADRYGEMSIDDIIGFNKRAKEGMKTFNTAGARKEAAQEAKISEAIAKARLKANEKQWNTLIKQSRKEKGSNQLDYAGIAERNIERATQMGTGSSLEKAYKKSVEKMAGSAAKEALRQNRKEFVGNIKIAALNQAKVNAGKEATANQVNAFSNAVIGKITTGAGTALGGAAVGAAVLAGKKVVGSMLDEQSANTVFANPAKDKDKSSAITQPQTIDQAWRDRKKKKKDDEDDD